MWRFLLEARLSLISANPIADLESLVDWLQGESEFRGKVTVSSKVPEDGHLGSVPQALVVALGSGGAVSVLVTTLKGWLSLPRRSSVKIKVIGKDGTEIEIDAKNIREKRIDALVDEVLNRESE
ncbi:effector-associated constant component EACC1 [Actinomadura citrea]|uniref:effector-associated constant component EACC1 n=1 Tax=Actinomadura citrea TaxID=46158 RepID=UPI003CE4C47F